MKTPHGHDSHMPEATGSRNEAIAKRGPREPVRAAGRPTSAAEVKLASTAGQAATTSKDVQGDRAGERGRWSWIINKLKDLGSGAWNKLKDAARAGYDAFKKAYERYVPWLVRKAIEVGATVYEVYSAVRDFIGL